MLPAKKQELIKVLNNYFISNSKNKEKLKEIVVVLNKRYNIDKSYSSSILLTNGILDTISEQMLFCLTDVIFNGNKNSYYFSEFEIRNFSNYKFENETSELKFNVIKIADDQFLTKINAKQLKEFSNKQLIHYEEKTQRPLRLKTQGENQYYKININKNAIKNMVNMFEKDKYIPTVITLNMPEDAVYDYVEETGELIISDIKYFDIIDGMHRYSAIVQMLNKNDDWDITMELRIVQFSINKARDFIFQENQKTKMHKIESESFNRDDIGNRIVEKMIAERGDLDGYLGLGKVIDSGYLGRIISIYVNDVLKVKDTSLKFIIEMKNLFYNGLLKFLEYDEKFQNHKWEKIQLFTACYIIVYDKDVKTQDKIINNIKSKNLQHMITRYPNIEKVGDYDV